MKKHFTLLALLCAMMLPVQAEVINGTCENTDIAWAYDTQTKTLRNGQLLILRDGKTYTATGVEVK